MSKLILRLILPVLACVASRSAAQGCVLAAPMNLEEMVARAESIVSGTCVSAEPVVAAVGGANLAATRYTFALDETIRGTGMRALSFEQFGAGGSLSGLPDFVPGERYLLLLSAPGAPGGLTSTVGLDQGAFRFVEDGTSHTERLLNGRANFGLLSGLSSAARARMNQTQPGGDAESLLDAVRALAGATP